jgi:hypothetical protein
MAKRIDMWQAEDGSIHSKKRAAETKDNENVFKEALADLMEECYSNMSVNDAFDMLWDNKEEWHSLFKKYMG